MARTPILIIGCARSGTTLFSQLLTQNPVIFICPETQFYQRIYGQRRLLNILPREMRINKIIDLLIKHEYPKIDSVFSKKISIFRKILRRTDNYNEAFMQIVAASSEAAIYGEKTPLHTFFVDNILSVQREIKILALCRDAPGVVASLLQRKNFKRTKNIMQCIVRWDLSNKEILRLKEQMPKPQFFLVRFEDLIEETERTMENVSDFLGIDYTSEMTQANYQDSTINTKSDVKNENTTCIDYDVLNRWQNVLNNSDEELIRRTASETLCKLGYKASHDFVPVHAKFAYSKELILQKMALGLMKLGIFPNGVL